MSFRTPSTAEKGTSRGVPFSVPINRIAPIHLGLTADWAARQVTYPLVRMQAPVRAWKRWIPRGRRPGSAR